MNLIYSHNLHTARSFALAQEFAPGDWKWINNRNAIRDFPRADIYKVPQWKTHPHADEIDQALEYARQRRRLGTVTDYS